MPNADPLRCLFNPRQSGYTRTRARLDTDPRLIPTIKLYESMGFSSEGFVENPYGLKLILFSKELPNSKASL
jgi:hypothetical protein